MTIQVAVAPKWVLGPLSYVVVNIYFNFHKIPYFGVCYLFYDVWWLLLKKCSEGEKTSEDDGICKK